VAQAAIELGIPLAQPASVNDDSARDIIAAARPEAACVCAFGALITEPLLSTYLMLNVHPSLLPRWRGAAPIERAVMAGDELTGVSIMRMGAGLDSGPVCQQASEPIHPDDTYGSLAGRLAELGGELLVRVLTEDPPCAEQDDQRATYAEKIASEDRLLDAGRTASELERVVRALSPHVGAYLELDGGLRLGVLGARAVEDGERSDNSPPLDITGPVPALRCRSGRLELLKVRPAGRREMSGEEWLRGLRQ
jgi:methionyl-tRNA formyltransferase